MPPLPTTLTELCAAHQAGERFDYLPFWGHTPPADGRVGPHVLSQWWLASFEVEGVRYASAEHFMMASKARVFGDDDALARVLRSPDPAAAKRIGREVRGFDSALWQARSFELVVEGNLHKFRANRELGDYLLSTAPALLVEASPRDRIWGIGLGPSNPDARDPTRWRGRNLLGFALTEVRRQLASAG